jgi:putative FmdB family regulatory protein
MPIFEYHCQDCGTDFEKLVRKSDDKVACPTCGDKHESHLEMRFSTFAAHANGSPSAAPQQSMGGGCPAGMCRTPGVCGRN